MELIFIQFGPYAFTASGSTVKFKGFMALYTSVNTSPGLGRTADRPYWVVLSSIVVRAIHQVGAAVFLAGYLLEIVSTIPGCYLIVVTLSGVILLIIEGLRHRQLFREMSGISTLLKLIVLGLAYHGWLPGIPAILFVFIIASLCSHAPKFIRHRLLF